MIRTLKLSLCHNPAGSQTVRYTAPNRMSLPTSLSMCFEPFVRAVNSSHPNTDPKVFEGRSHQREAPDVAAHGIISPVNRLDSMVC